VAKGVKTIPHPPADFFPFPSVKFELAGVSLTQDTFKGNWDGVIWIIPKAISSNFALHI
jgi:hypothetical protein